MNNKRSIQIGIILLILNLLFCCSYFLRRTPDGANWKIDSEPKLPVKVPKRSPPINIKTDTILSGNVFHPSRGNLLVDKNVKSNISAITQKTQQFELTGIFRYHNTCGALIRVPQEIAPQKKTLSRKMYKLGDPLGNGYKLVEISETHIVIAQGSEKITLQLRKKQDQKK